MSKTIEDAVRSKYASVALSGLSSDQAGVQAVAEAFGYSPEELSSIPAEANLGVSCGNPTAFASLKPGEVVVDLGSGGGLDVFLAAQQVGPTGKAIGIDMTQEMIDLARRNLAKSKGPDGQPLANVEFHLATIDRMLLPDASADCVISNCVLNLVPDKPAALREIARILKPGGRLAVSDIALKQPLPPELGQDMLAYVGCIAGAVLIEDYRKNLLGAGFAHVQVVETGADLNAYAKIENQASCCAPTPGKASLTVVESCCSSAPTGDTPELLERMADLLRRYNVNDYAASVRIYAVKPHSEATASKGKQNRGETDP